MRASEPKSGSKLLNAALKRAQERLMTDRYVAEQMGCHQTTISFWRLGKVTPSCVQLERLLDVVGYDVKLEKRPKK